MIKIIFIIFATILKAKAVVPAAAPTNSHPPTNNQNALKPNDTVETNKDFKNMLYPPPAGTSAQDKLDAAQAPTGQTSATLEGGGVAARAGLGYKSELLDGFYEDFVYEPTGKRDPFSIYVPKSFLAGPITSPLQKYALEELKLVAIVWNVKKPKAMVIDPTGASYIVIENDKIGKSDGYVAKIREGEIVVIEVHADLDGNKAYLTKTMLLRKK